MDHHTDAVIAALKVALEEADSSCDDRWDVEATNRWIDLLPEADDGRWSQLILDGDADNEVSRSKFIAHVRATLAYLETFRRAHMETYASTPADPIDADFETIAYRRPAIARLE